MSNEKLLINDSKSNNGEVMRNKHIEEMAEVMCNLNTKEGCFCYGGYCNHNCLDYDKAERLYNAGYRKQEWISVDERLPEEYGDYLVAVKTKKLWETEWEHGVSVACFVISEVPNVNGWNIEIEDGYQYEITHWMPLPEAPKMQGGK